MNSKGTCQHQFDKGICVFCGRSIAERGIFDPSAQDPHHPLLCTCSNCRALMGGADSSVKGQNKVPKCTCLPKALAGGMVAHQNNCISMLDKVPEGHIHSWSDNTNSSYCTGCMKKHYEFQSKNKISELEESKQSLRARVFTILSNYSYDLAMLKKRNGTAPATVAATAITALITQKETEARLDELNSLAFDAAGEDYDVDQYSAHIEHRLVELKTQQEKK